MAEDLIDGARAFLDTWVARFNTRDPEQLLPLYAEDGLLLGTSQARLFVGRDDMRRYFRGGSTVALDDVRSMQLSDDTVLCAGTYSFTRRSDGSDVVNPARCTFVLRVRDGAWQVVHHHSSAQPR